MAYRLLYKQVTRKGEKVKEEILSRIEQLRGRLEKLETRLDQPDRFAGDSRIYAEIGIQSLRDELTRLSRQIR